MTMTEVQDLIQIPMFADYVRQQMIERSVLVKSGIAAPDPVIAARCAAGVSGKTVTLPFFNSLDNADDEEVLVEDNALTPDKIDASQDVAVICRRGKAFACSDLAADLSGQDPIAAVAAQIADFRNKMDQKRLVAVMNGVFGRNHASDNDSLCLDLSGTTMGKTDLLLGAQKLGDRKLELTAVAMNSAVGTYLSGLDTNASLYKPSQGAASLPTYNGRTIVEDDTIPYDASTGVATVYLFGRGAVALNEVPEKVPYETDREKLKGNDILITRHAGICHLRGYAWTGTASGAAVADGGPTNTQLGTAGNWDRVYDAKQIRCVKMLVKIA